MDLHEEIAKVACELYEKSGRIEGRDRENWLDAERIVLTRHAGQDMEEPEGEEPITEEEIIAAEVEGTELKPASQEKEEEDETTVMEESEVRETSIAGKKATKITGAPERTMPAKKVSPKKKTAAQKAR